VSASVGEPAVEEKEVALTKLCVDEKRLDLCLETLVENLAAKKKRVPRFRLFV
jgi:hypothetical protein